MIIFESYDVSVEIMRWKWKEKEMLRSSHNISQISRSFSQWLPMVRREWKEGDRMRRNEKDGSEEKEMKRPITKEEPR